MICRGLCACAEMLWMCVLYVSFGSKIKKCKLFVWIQYEIVLSRQKLSVGMVVYISWLHSCLCGCDGDVICIGHDLNRCTWWW